MNVLASYDRAPSTGPGAYIKATWAGLETTAGKVVFVTCHNCERVTKVEVVTSGGQVQGKDVCDVCMIVHPVMLSGFREYAES